MAPSGRADSIERTAQVCPSSHSDKERRIARAEPSAHGHQTSGQAGPGKAASRRSRARKARALTGVGWSGNAPAGADRAVRLSREKRRAHCVDLLSTKKK